MTDSISLTGLRARGNHGVFDAERRDGQDFVVDAVLDVDTRTAAASDELGDTVDYGALSGALVAIITGDPVCLLETLAARLADACLANARVAGVRITVHKPQAPIPHEFADVSVMIHRTREDVRTGQ